MRNEVIAAVFCVAASVGAVKYVEDRDAIKSGTIVATNEAAANLVPGGKAKPTAAAATYGGRWSQEVRIQKGSHNQFFVTALVNRNASSFLVDTGASYVALRESDAAASGIYTRWADYTHAVRTANGETKAAFVKIDAIEIDGIRVTNVDAFVLPDDQLGVNLLGMSFLSELQSVEARNGELLLKG